MMRKLLAVAVAATLMFSIVPTVGQAATPPTQAELLLKKKKLAAQLKALQQQQAALDKTLAAAKAPIKKPLKAKPTDITTASVTPIKVKKVSFAAVKPVQSTATVAHLRPCGSFLKCLFGNKHRKVTASAQNASFGQYAKSGLSGNTTNEVIAWTETKYPVGSLIVRTPERALYFVSGKDEAIRYSVGVGREGMQWSGTSRIAAKAEWPSWTPPAEMIKREAAKGHILPPFMEGGPGNPLGARALYIGGRIYRVHGTNNEASIGGAVSSGCIRMMNADVIDLYKRVKVGARIYVYQ